MATASASSPGVIIESSLVLLEALPDHRDRLRATVRPAHRGRRGGRLPPRGSGTGLEAGEEGDPDALPGSLRAPRPGGVAVRGAIRHPRPPGSGAMGKVYKARHRLMGRIVALKFIAREYLVRPNAVPRFLREMRLVGRLDHPNIVRALDAEEIGRDPCIVMEYVPGRDLERLLLDRGPLPAEEVSRWRVPGDAGTRPCGPPRRSIATSSRPTSSWARTAGSGSSTWASPH